MNQIRIGTCIPGPFAEAWMPHLVKAGFETVSVNNHMSLNGTKMEEQAPKLLALIEGTGVQITTFGYYCNALQYEEHKKTLAYAIDNAHLYGAKTVSTFAGAYEGKSVEESMGKFGEVFRELSKRAEDKGVKIAIENCPMGGTWDNLTCNLGFTPRAWEMMFNEVSSPALGLEWEPAHQMIQLIDPIPQLRKWVKKVYHMHGKDASVDWAYVRENGVMGNSDLYAPERTVGFGDTNWRDIFTILHMGGYEGDICVEGYHDPVYSRDWEMVGQMHALNYLKWCRGGEFVENPWPKVHFPGAPKED